MCLFSPELSTFYSAFYFPSTLGPPTHSPAHPFRCRSPTKVYWEDNVKRCGCCRVCEQQIPVQQAFVYSTTCPSPSKDLIIETMGPAKGTFASSAGLPTKLQKHAAKGLAAPRTIKAPSTKKNSRKVTYGVRVRTPTKKAVVGNFGVLVTLPAGVSYTYAATKPKTIPSATVEGTIATGYTLTWQGVGVRYKKPAIFKVVATVSSATPLHTLLTFTAATFTPGLFGEKNCLQYAGNTTTTVVP